MSLAQTQNELSHLTLSDDNDEEIVVEFSSDGSDFEASASDAESSASGCSGNSFVVPDSDDLADSSDFTIESSDDESSVESPDNESIVPPRRRSARLRGMYSTTASELDGKMEEVVEVVEDSPAEEESDVELLYDSGSASDGSHESIGSSESLQDPVSIRAQIRTELGSILPEGADQVTQGIWCFHMECGTSDSDVCSKEPELPQLLRCAARLSPGAILVSEMRITNKGITCSCSVCSRPPREPLSLSCPFIRRALGLHKSTDAALLSDEIVIDLNVLLHTYPAQRTIDVSALAILCARNMREVDVGVPPGQEFKCAICVQELDDSKEDLCVCDKSGSKHMMHYCCLKSWYGYSSDARKSLQCPICRQKLNGYMHIKTLNVPAHEAVA